MESENFGSLGTIAVTLGKDSFKKRWLNRRQELLVQVCVIARRQLIANP